MTCTLSRDGATILTSAVTLSAASLLSYFPSWSVIKLYTFLLLSNPPRAFSRCFLLRFFSVFLFPPWCAFLLQPYVTSHLELWPSWIRQAAGSRSCCHHQTARPNLHRVSWWRLQSNARFQLFQGGLREVSDRGHKYSFDLPIINRLKTVYVLPRRFSLLSHQLNKMKWIWHGKINGGLMRRSRLSTQAADVSSRMTAVGKNPTFTSRWKHICFCMQL